MLLSPDNQWIAVNRGFFGHCNNPLQQCTATGSDSLHFAPGE
jgi:hypothetical protein